MEANFFVCLWFSSQSITLPELIEPNPLQPVLAQMLPPFCLAAQVGVCPNQSQLFILTHRLNYSNHLLV